MSFCPLVSRWFLVLEKRSDELWHIRSCTLVREGRGGNPPVPEEAAKIRKTILDRMKERDAGPGAVVDHVQKDPLIGLAFAGRRANAIPDTEAADPPPMQHSAFVNLVQD